MDKALKEIIERHADDEQMLNRVLTTLFVQANSIPVTNNTFIKSLLLEGAQKAHLPVTFDTLIEAFELAIQMLKRLQTVQCTHLAFSKNLS